MPKTIRIKWADFKGIPESELTDAEKQKLLDDGVKFHYSADFGTRVAYIEVNNEKYFILE